MRAVELVNILLEYNPYDVDDSLEKEDYPLGFVAIGHWSTIPERIEWRLEKNKYGVRYVFSKYWYDSYNKKLQLFQGGSHSVRNVAGAIAFVNINSAEFRKEGWDVELL